MTAKFVLFAFKSVLVGLIATGASGLPMAALLTWGMNPKYLFDAVLGALYLAALGNFLIGLPIALAAFRFFRGEMGLGKLFSIANLAGFSLILLVTALGGFFATFFYGIPIAMAANAYAVAGWLLIIKPAIQLCERGVTK